MFVFKTSSLYRFYKLFFFFFIAINCSAFYAGEFITDFSSFVTINRTGSTDIEELITVNKPAGTRGIVWEIPVRYQGHTIDFTLNAITCNGSPESYHLEKRSHGIRIYIGRSDYYLKEGVYHYSVSYTLENHISYAQDRRHEANDPVAKKDVLYINLPGPEWRLPIRRASAVFTFPTTLAPRDIMYIAYTGPVGSQEKDYTAQWVNNDHLMIRTTRPVLPGQALTISVAWPEGVIAYPSFLQKTSRFIRNNFLFIIALLLYIIGITIIIIFIVGRVYESKSITVIPLFYPPDDLPPALMEFIVERGNAAPRGLASEILAMAVAGLLTIEYKKGGFLRSHYYVLHRLEDAITEGSIFTAKKDLLFSGKKLLSLNNQQDGVQLSLLDTFLKNEQARIQYRYIITYRWWQMVVNLCFIVGIVLNVASEVSFMAIVGGVGLFLVHNLFLHRFFMRYTQAGILLKSKIEGFKLFLKTTEIDRLRIVGSPPTKTPELYEKYLPFAVVLGVEKEWTAQFASVIAALSSQREPYKPVWYAGPSSFVYSSLFVRSFSHAIATNLPHGNNFTLSPSSWTPRSTGFGGGGGGSSGGGVGGSGGGSW